MSHFDRLVGQRAAHRPQRIQRLGQVASPMRRPSSHATLNYGGYRFVTDCGEIADFRQSVGQTSTQPLQNHRSHQKWMTCRSNASPCSRCSRFIPSPVHLSDTNRRSNPGHRWLGGEASQVIAQWGTWINHAWKWGKKPYDQRGRTFGVGMNTASARWPRLGV